VQVRELVGLVSSSFGVAGAAGVAGVPAPAMWGLPYVFSVRDAGVAGVAGVCRCGASNQTVKAPHHFHSVGHALKAPHLLFFFLKRHM